MTSPFLAATEAALIELVESATRRLVILAPAVSASLADAIAAAWNRLGSDRVSVILDVDPEVYRLGYGDPKALAILESAGQRMGKPLHRQAHIRIGLILADERMLVYSPVPMLVEAGERDANAPNAILLDGVSPHVEAALGAGKEGHLYQSIGLDKATQLEIAALDADLKANPPLRFDIQRYVRVFNAAFQFVELTVRGTYLARRIVKLPTTLLGIADPATRADLKVGLRLLATDHELGGASIAEKRKRLEQQYLRQIPGYGYVIERKDKDAFEADLKLLEQEVDAFRVLALDQLKHAIAMKVDNLVEAFVDRVSQSPPRSWLLPAGQAERHAAIRKYLKGEIVRALGSAAHYAKEMRVAMVYKDVTYESLCDPRFIALAQKAFPHLRQLRTLSDAAPGRRVG